MRIGRKKHDGNKSTERPVFGWSPSQNGRLVVLGQLEQPPSTYGSEREDVPTPFRDGLIELLGRHPVVYGAVETRAPEEVFRGLAAIILQSAMNDPGFFEGLKVQIEENKRQGLPFDHVL